MSKTSNPCDRSDHGSLLGASAAMGAMVCAGAYDARPADAGEASVSVLAAKADGADGHAPAAFEPASEGDAGALASFEAGRGEGFASEERIVSTICRSNCFQGCMLNAHVRDGKVVKMSPGVYPEEVYSGCCLRGLSLPERAYSKTRVRHPLRRAEGTERGAGQWERVSWDDAIDEIAEKFKAIREEYGPRAIAFDSASGNYGAVQGIKGVALRFCNILELTKLNVCYDQSYGYGTNRVIGGGAWGFPNEAKGMLYSKTILIWGSNPVNSQMHNWRIIQRAKENGARVICIDPMYSLTASRCDEFIAVRPGSDLIVALAILNEIVKDDRIDADYAKRCTTAPFLLRKDTGLFLRRSDIEGGELASVRDGETLMTPGNTKKDPAYVWDEAAGRIAPYTACETPALEGEFTVDGIEVETVYSALKRHAAQYSLAEASEMSQIPVERIRDLANVFAEQGPVFVYAVYGIDHYQNAHLFSQAMAIICALTNNISRLGSSVGGMCNIAGIEGNPAFFVGRDATKAAYTGIPQTEFANVLASGRHKGEDFPIKALIVSAGNPMSNYAEQNRWLDDVVPNLDFIVVLDTELTDTARYSDLVLPACFWFEGDDVRPNQGNPFIVYGNKAMEPLHESKLDSEIFALIAGKMGMAEDFPLLDPKEWLDILFDTDHLRALGITPEALRKNKTMRCIGKPDLPFVRGWQGAEFPTPSGRAELYCEAPLPRVDYGQDWRGQAEKEHFPSFQPPGEGWYQNELHDKYPLVYMQSHEKYRVHSQWFAVDTLRELDFEPKAFLARADAEERGIAEGDIVEVFNDRGCVTAKAAINDACPPGVMYMPKGWQRHQHREGCFQDLTSAKSNPLAVNFAYFDALVDVRRKERG